MSDDLLTGIAAVVDDQALGSDDANTLRLLGQLDDAGMPYVVYTELPTLHSVRHLRDVAFLLLDWRLAALPVSAGAGVLAGDEPTKALLHFLGAFLEVSFAPVFIFSNQAVEDIERRLDEHFADRPGARGRVHVRAKEQLADDRLMLDEVRGWIARHPSVYALKRWDAAYTAAKNELFIDLYGASDKWPAILWRTSQEDDCDPNHEISLALLSNLQTRMAPVVFDESRIGVGDMDSAAIGSEPEGTDQGQTHHCGDEALAGEDVRAVWEGTYFTPGKRLTGRPPAAGDVFRCEERASFYYLNITPDCDALHGPSAPKWPHCGAVRAECPIRVEASGGLFLRCIEGELISLDAGAAKTRYQCRGGEVLPTAYEDFVVVDPTRWGDRHQSKQQRQFPALRFDFRRLCLMAWDQAEKCRIGRVGPPIITRILQRYALHVQRVALPRIPKELLPPEPTKNGK